MSNGMMELIAGYDSYTDAGELNASAAADAPATTFACAASVAIISYYTYQEGC